MSKVKLATKASMHKKSVQVDMKPLGCAFTFRVGIGTAHGVTNEGKPFEAGFATMVKTGAPTVCITVEGEEGWASYVFPWESLIQACVADRFGPAKIAKKAK